MKAGATLASLPLMAATTASVQAEDANQTTTMTDTKSEEFINGMADLMAHSTRAPILRWPHEYGMEFEEIYFPALDGVTIEGWFIPADSDRLVICNHPMPCNRYGYPGHLEPWTNFGGFEVNFPPEYKVLHDAGYNIIAYDMRNHGRSGTGSGGVNGHGVLEYRDVGSMRYAKSRPDTKGMKTVLYSRCLAVPSWKEEVDPRPMVRKRDFDLHLFARCDPAMEGMSVAEDAMDHGMGSASPG